MPQSLRQSDGKPVCHQSTRYTYDHNPVDNVNWLRFLKLDWIQAVLFVEGGRVAPTYNRHVLYDDWKADYGFSLRALTAGMVVRLDVAKSSEGTNMWAMISPYIKQQVVTVHSI
jgi:hypothetical protein